MVIPPSVELCLVGALAALAFAVGVRLSVGVPRTRPYLLAASLYVALGYAWTFSGRIGWISSLPIDSVMVWSNLMPVLLSFTAGISCRSERLQGWRRPVAMGLFVVLAMGYIVTPQIRATIAPLQFNSTARWSEGICLQSHPASCSPAAAATLLRQKGIRATEQSMARVCLTSKYGTEPLGLFRGLSVASRGSAVFPAAASTDPERWVQLNQLPNVALIEFERNQDLRAIDRLLEPGHAVVVMGRLDDGRWEIADPAFGITTWTDTQFRDRFTGDAIFLDRF